MGAQAIDLEQAERHRDPLRPAQSSLQTRIEDVAELVGDEIDADDRTEQRDSWKKLIQYLPESKYW
jgi:hypothetical protein